MWHKDFEQFELFSLNWIAEMTGSTCKTIKALMEENNIKPYLVPTAGMRTIRIIVSKKDTKRLFKAVEKLHKEKNRRGEK